MEESDMKQVISFFSDEEVKVVWKEEDKFAHMDEKQQ